MIFPLYPGAKVMHQGTMCAPRAWYCKVSEKQRKSHIYGDISSLTAQEVPHQSGKK